MWRAGSDEVVDELWTVAELAAWLASPVLSWVGRSGRRPLALIESGQLTSPLSTRRMMRWERALTTGGLRDVAELAAAFASWGAGERPTARDALEDRAVDLTLRASALASDGHRLALLRKPVGEDAPLEEPFETPAACRGLGANMSP